MKENFTLRNLLTFIILLCGMEAAVAQFVTSEADDGAPGTLRSQVAAAGAGDVISFGLGVENITLTAGEIAIDKNLTITGNLITEVTISGGETSRIFNITNGTLTLNDLTMTDGVAENGGAVNIANGSLILNSITISDCVANGASGSGGAIFVGTGGSLIAVGSTLSNNRANRAGGAIESTAGTTITLNNVTLDSNNAGVAPATAAPGNGGGVHITGNGNAIILGGNVTNNIAAAEGGGLWNGAGTMEINETLITGNTASGAAADNGGGGIFNLSGMVMIQDATITENSADGAAGSGGGILNDVGGTVTISGSEITLNTSNRAGGGIENNAGTVSMTNVNLNQNVTNTSPGNGGGLHVTGAGTVTINGGAVNGNSAGAEGGGLWNGTGTMTIDGTEILNNTAAGAGADQGGGGIYNLNGGTLSIEDATISQNQATGTLGSGGGILNDVGSQLSISNSTISGNTAIRAGGGIEDNSGTSTIMLTNVILNDNAVTGPPGNGGGLHITGGGSVMIEGGTVNGNTASSEGGGLWNGTGTMTIAGTTISNNTAAGAGADQGGGGIYNLNGGTLAIENATISQNQATGTLGSGGGILNDVGSQLSVSNSTISGNTAIRAGGGIEDNSGTSTIMLTNVILNDNAVTGPPGNGGGLHITGGGSVMINGGTVTGNTAALEGGGLWNGSGTMTISDTVINDNIAQGAAADDGGGAIFNNGGTLNIEGAEIMSNLANGTSGSGGGLLSISGAVTINNSTFELNSANRAGGAIEVIAGSLTLSGTDLTNNDVDGGAGTPNPGNGGGIHISGVTTTIINGGIINENDARREGGGLWNQTGGTMTVNNVIIDSNTASGPDAVHGGGGIFNNGGDLIVNSSTIVFNTSDGVAGNGGGIHVKAGTATIMTSTISTNWSESMGGGIYSNAGLMVNASTIAENSAAMMGGGIATESATSATIKNTIVALNDAPAGMQISNSGAAITSAGYNLVSMDDANVFMAMPTDIEGTMDMPADPMLGPLADNGGPTPTHALLEGSMAYNAGDPMDMFLDQTGAAVFGGIRDIGAYEAQMQLGVGDITLQSGMKSQVYPNPAIGGTVNIALAGNFERFSANLINLSSGKVVKTFDISASDSAIDVADYAAGIYVIQVVTDNFVETHKLVINN